jgi:hypothetical protein
MEEIPDTSAATIANAAATKANKPIKPSISEISRPIYALFATGILTEIKIYEKTPI